MACWQGGSKLLIKTVGSHITEGQGGPHTSNPLVHMAERLLRVCVTEAPWDFDFSSLLTKLSPLDTPRMAGTTLLFQISFEMMGKIPILRSLRDQEKQAGKAVTLQDEHRQPLEAASQRPAPPSAVRRPWDPPRLESGSVQGADVSSNTVYVGNLPRDTRVSELKRSLRELGAAPLRLTWQGPQRRAFLQYQDAASAQHAVSCLQGLRLGPSTLKVALARQQRASDLTIARPSDL